MLVHTNKRVLMNFFCYVHQHGRHCLCHLSPTGLKVTWVKTICSVTIQTKPIRQYFCNWNFPRIFLSTLGNQRVKSLAFRALFNWVSKIISQLFWFCIATLLWLAKRISRHFLDQSEVKPKPIVIYSHAFSRAWDGRHVFASSSDWFVWLFTTVCDWSE